MSCITIFSFLTLQIKMFLNKLEDFFGWQLEVFC